MRFKHKDGERSTSKVTVPNIGSVEVREDNTFEVDEGKADIGTLKDVGHIPVDETPNEESDSEEPDLSGYSEEDIVTMGYRELQQIAGDFEDIKGNVSEGEIEEALINKLR